jgi:biopolymer transport protein TolR
MAGSSLDSNGIVGINVTPLVDITLVLLIIFIVTAKIIDTPAVPLDLPKASQAEGVQVVFSVVIPKSGPMLVDGVAVPDEDTLMKRAKAALDKDPDLRAVIQADGDVPHRVTLRTLDRLKKVGITKVAFGAEVEEDGPTPK